eukprot:3914127-Prymnesium_polylepis.1
MSRKGGEVRGCEKGAEGPKNRQTEHEVGMEVRQRRALSGRRCRRRVASRVEQRSRKLKEGRGREAGRSATEEGVFWSSSPRRRRRVVVVVSSSSQRALARSSSSSR